MAQTMARMAESGRAKIKEVGVFVVFLKKEKNFSSIDFSLLVFCKVIDIINTTLLTAAHDSFNETVMNLD